MTEHRWNYKYALPALFYAALIFLLSSLPSSAVPNLGISFGDLIIHFIEYSVFGYLLALAIMKSPDKLNWKNFCLVFFIGSLFAASDEYHQSFVEGRFSEVSDFLADSIGVVAGVRIFAKFGNFFRGIFRKRSVGD